MAASKRSKSLKYWTATALFVAGASGASACGTSSEGTGEGDNGYQGTGGAPGGTGAGGVAGVSGTPTTGGVGGTATVGGTTGVGGAPGGASGTTSVGGAGGSVLGGAAGIAGAIVAGAAGDSGAGGMTAGSGGAATGGTTTGGAGGVGGMGGAGGSAGKAGGATGGSAGSGTPADAVWTKNIRLNDDTGSGAQYEVALASGPNNLVMAGWMDERSTRVCAFSVSTNNGDTWSRNYSISVSGSQFVGDPAVAIDGGGTLYAGCQDYGLSQIRLMTSTDKGMTWSTVRSIQSAPDKPWLGGGTAAGTVFVSWLGNPGGIKRSTDFGMTWGTTQSTGNIIHGTSIDASTTGMVHVPYNLDSNRNQLRYLRSTNNGMTYETARDLVANMGTFGFNASPRQHPIVGSGADPTGRCVAITWSSQMPGGESQEDVWVLYSVDSGATWTQPIRVNDNTQNSRQFQPWVDVDAHCRVHVAWTDLRTDGMNKTYYARSNDPRQGFERNMEITDGRGAATADFLGDYKGLVVSGPDVLVVWNDTRRDRSDIYFSKAPGAAGP